MKINAAKNSVPDRARVDADFIRIGKDVIEILTSGMYVSPVTIYREYVQNAADAIDAARAQGLFTNRDQARTLIDKLRRLCE